MAKRKYDINNLSGLDYKSILDNVDGLGDAYTKANNALHDLIESNKKYKDIMSELADLENKLAETKKNGGDVTKAQKDLNDAQAKYAKNLQEIYEKTYKLSDEARKQADIDKIKLELSQDINKELEKEHRYWQKQSELRNLEIKSIREGLTWDEKRYQLLTKFGEQIGINTDKFKTGFNDLKKNLSEAKSGIDGLNKAWGAADHAAADYTKRIGGTAASMKTLRDTTIDFMAARSIGIKYNTSMEELIKLQGDYNASIGRSIDLTNDQKETFAAMKTVVGNQAAMDFSLKLENFGLNPDEVGSRVGQMFSEAAKSGVAFEKYSKNFLDNIKLAQNYNFQNGLKGLASMAKKASEIKLDMQQVASFADKVSTLEGAVTAGANLSVLGGSFAQMGNPLSMLYEGLNNIEGLQDRMVNMFGKMGKWDYSKGQIDVSVFNKQRIKAASEAMGIDYSKTMEMINASARRNIVEGKLGSQYNNDKDFKELLLNKAQLDEKGNAFVTINGERKDVNKLSKADENYLKTANNSDSDNIAEIAVNTRGFKDLSEGFDKQKDVGSAQVNKMTHLGETTKSILSSVGEKSWLMAALGSGSDLLKVISGTLGSFYASYMMFSSFGGGGIGNAVGKGGNLAGYNVARSFAKGGIGKVLTFGGNKTALGKSAVGNITKAGGYGKYFARGAGLGAGLGIAGSVGDMVINNTELGKNKGEYVAGYTTSKALTGAAKGAGIGAAVGSIIPGIGTAVGTGIGAAVGGIWGLVAGNIEAKKENIANQLRSRYGATINNPDTYSIDELEQMMYGSKALSPTLTQKMSSNGDNLGGYNNGGIVKDGPSDKDSLIHGKAVKAGEYIVNADATKNNLPVLEAINNGNSLNIMEVASNKQSENKQVNNNSSSEIRIKPIEINLSGNLSINGEKVDTQKLLDAITPSIIDQINEQLMNRNNFRIDRNKIHKKYAY